MADRTLTDGDRWRAAYVEVCAAHAATVPRTRRGLPDPILIARRAHADLLARCAGELRAAGQRETDAATALAEYGIIRLGELTDHEQMLRERRRRPFWRRPTAPSRLTR